MKNIAKKAIPLACVLGAPFFVNANEQSEANAMLCASNYPSNKMATSNSSVQSNGNGSKSNTSMMNSQITPPAGPLVSNGADVYLTADFLWWKAEQEGLEFAYTGTTATHTTNVSKGHMYSPHFKYEPGFKVGLGVLSGHDNWDFFAQYTWLNVPSSNTRKTEHYNGTDKLNGVLLQGNGNNTLSYYNYTDQVSGSWNFNFNVLDLEMGRNFWISKRLSLRPHIGMKFSWMKQIFKVNGQGAHDPNQETSFAYANKKYDLSQFGVGIRAGINTAFYMWNKWSIFGDLDWTALWNDFSSSHKTTITESAGDTAYTNVNIHNKLFTLTGVLEAALGLRFETIFSKGRYMYMLQAGWETQVWFDQGNFINRVNFAAPANLSLEGLTIKTGFWF